MVVGYIGLGVMGRPAALNLLRANWPLQVYARRTESLRPLLAAGAESCSTPRMLAERCTVVVTNVSDTPDVEEVVLGAQGVIHGMKAGGVVVDMSTISPRAARRIAQELAAKNIAFLDAPVSGGERGAIDGSLTFMVGGAAAAFEKVLPILQTMGATITRVGDSGAGQVAKACNQIVIGAALCAAAESLELARACGVDGDKVRAALLGGFAASRVLEVHAKRMLENNYAPGFKSRLHMKDIDIAIAAAETNGVALPSARLFAARLRRLLAAHGGDLDSSAIATVAAEE